MIFLSKKSKGFTLIELLVVVAVISLLASIIFASLGSARTKGKDAAAKSQMKSLQSEASLYYSTNSTYTGMWNAGTNATKIFNNLVVIEDNTLFRGVGSTGDYYYAALQLKNNNVLCLDANNMKEVTSVGWVWPTGNFVCP